MRGLGLTNPYAAGTVVPVSSNYPTLPADDSVIDAGTVTAHFDWQFWALVGLAGFAAWKFLGSSPRRKKRR